MRKVTIICSKSKTQKEEPNDTITFSLEQDEMKKYIDKHGWHFSKELCEDAISQMKGTNFTPYNKGQVDAILKQNDIDLCGYDATYVYNMARSDFYGSSIPNEMYLARYVKDYLCDIDGYEGIAFKRYIADCEAKNIFINWKQYNEDD